MLISDITVGVVVCLFSLSLFSRDFIVGAMVCVLVYMSSRDSMVDAVVCLCILCLVDFLVIMPSNKNTLISEYST